MTGGVRRQRPLPPVIPFLRAADVVVGATADYNRAGMTDARGLLRLRCPFCSAEVPLWFRPDADERTMTPAEWERWLDTPCSECGKLPRDASDPSSAYRPE